MPACVSGTTFEWPQVGFRSPDQAGNAVAVALQDATCTFTVAPVPIATPTPKPPVPGVVRALRIRAHDGQIDLVWAPPAAPDPPVIDYLSRCAAGDGDWLESTEGISVKTTATVLNVPDANDYRCEVAAVGADGPGQYVAATAATLVAPPAPDKPTVGPLDRAVQVTITPGDATVVTGYHYECSADNGQTWPATFDAAADKTSVEVGALTNGSSYVCRAFAQGTGGRSDASPVSDVVRPCGSPFECTPVLVPIAGIFGLVVLGVIAFLVAAFLRSRRRGYVVAVVDVVHTANLGHGSKTGIRFVKDPSTRRLTGLIADRGPEADIRIRHLGGGRFVVRDRLGRRIATAGESIITADSVGVRHELVLRAFDTKAASQVTSRV
jgi:hypothetical protein